MTSPNPSTDPSAFTRADADPTTKPELSPSLSSCISSCVQLKGWLARTAAVVAAMVALALTTASCGAIAKDLAADPPGQGPTVAPEVTDIRLVVPDTSGSMLGTGALTSAQNETTTLVKTMPVGSQVVVRAVNSNVAGQCQDLVFDLPAQPNRDVGDQVRQANENAVARKLAAYLTCSAGQGGATELWGGLTDAFDAYPQTTAAWVFSDTCETVSVHPSTCTGKKLRDKSYPRTVVDQLDDQGNVATLAHGTTITYVGVGQDAGLRSNEVKALRTIATTWTKRAGGTAKFATT